MYYCLMEENLLRSIKKYENLDNFHKQETCFIQEPINIQTVKQIRMKIIHIFTVFLTSETFFDGQFKYLASQGEKIIVVSSYHPDAKSFADRNGIRFVPVKMPREMEPISIVKAIGDIIKLIKSEKPDAVFGHTPVGAFCAMIASKWCGVKNRVYYRHGLIYTTMKGVRRQIFRKEEQFVASLATGIVNVSHSLSRVAVRDNLNSDKKQYVIGHGTCGGIDAVNMFNPALLEQSFLEKKRKELHLDGTNIVYGFCGRICNDKGIPELIDGFEMFQRKHPDVKSKLVFIGSLDLRDGISDKRQQQIKSNRDIIVTGQVKRVDIPYFYSLLDVFVFPSHREGFGMSVIEASAMKKPILVSHVHGCEDSIVEHETGEYIKLTAESICHGMVLIRDTKTRLVFGENGRNMVLKWYDSRVMWPLVLDLYKQILK